jgi:hypothetical protein
MVCDNEVRNCSNYQIKDQIENKQLGESGKVRGEPGKEEGFPCANGITEEHEKEHRQRKDPNVHSQPSRLFVHKNHPTEKEKEAEEQGAVSPSSSLKQRINLQRRHCDQKQPSGLHLRVVPNMSFSVWEYDTH